MSRYSIVLNTSSLFPIAYLLKTAANNKKLKNFNLRAFLKLVVSHSSAIADFV